MRVGSCFSGPAASPFRKRDGKGFPGRRVPLLPTLALLPLLIAGCLDSIESPIVTGWEGILLPVEGSLGDPVSGSVAMSTGLGQTEIGIGLEEQEPGRTFGWHVREGTCEGSGEPLAPTGAWGTITVQPDGRGTEFAFFNRNIAAEQDYAAEVFRGGEGDGGARVACADLEIPGGFR